MNLKLKTKRVNFIDSAANYVYKMRKQFQSPPNYSFVSTQSAVLTKKKLEWLLIDIHFNTFNTLYTSELST